ncbi:MAG: YggS family pyridoxal phosphate-dependent enzyme [Mariprofundaceae bacterium]|nr:YggS family pyridoxal phosphate-dependent enzyme [Mariprofundaceae bacterium]
MNHPQVNQLIQQWANICTALATSHTRLIAVSKYTSDAAVQTLLDAGQCDFGESRPQNLRDRAMKFPHAQWHFIGPLQKNKAKYIGKYAYMWHSLNDLDTAKLVAKHVDGRQLPVLIQVNISNELQKQGILPEELRALYTAISELKGLEVIGLMGMAAKDGDARAAFQRLRKLGDDLQQEYGTVPELCMGMSGDWALAVEEGASMVRLGSTLFDSYNATHFNET